MMRTLTLIPRLVFWAVAAAVVYVAARYMR